MADYDNNYDRRIALIGDTGSGKTTSIAATDLFCLRDIRKMYSFDGNNGDSKKFLMAARKGFAENSFPTATVVEQNLEFLLKKFNKDINEYEPYVYISLIDAPGKILLDLLHQDDLAENIASSHGIIFLINHSQKDNLELIETMIETIRLKIHDSNATLPHRLSICISQYDSPQLFDTLVNEEYTTDSKLTYNEKSIYYPWIQPYIEQPQIPGPYKRKYKSQRPATARDVLENYVPGGSDIINRLRQNFYMQRIKYMVTSSVGFLYKPNEKGELRVDYHDYSNIICINGRDQIRDYENMMPVNLLMPILWISEDNKS